MIQPHPEWQWRWIHNGLILPWFTKPCLDWLVTLDLSRKTAMEWGIGCDIPWWCHSAKKFIGIEHDAATGKHHENAKPTANSILCYAGVPTGEDKEADARTDVNYVSVGAAMIQRFTPDVVVIDGIYRVGCAKQLAGWFKISNAAGTLNIQVPEFVIVDNAEWPGLQTVRDLFESIGLKRTSYVQPDHAEGWTTDVWSR